MNIHLRTLGCRLNEAELERWAEQFLDLGHTISTDPLDADLLVINSCAVTREAAKKSRQIIRRTHQSNPAARLVLTGCYASLKPGLRETLPGIDLLISNSEKDRLVEIVNHQLLKDVLPETGTSPADNPLYQRGRHRAFIKIQDGCRHHCTYCIVTVARGEERSRTPADIIAQVNRLSAQGVKEVVLTGVHAGGYGSDLDTNLYKLLQCILKDTDIPRIRLASVEPWDLPDDFFELFSNTRLMPHMHLPLQSGDDVMLRRMGRRCRTTDFTTLVNRARSTIPDFNITTDIIVGFPGETPEHWQRGLDFIRKTRFSHIHIFPFSPRTGTAAASMPDRVTDAERQMRCRELRGVAMGLREDFLTGQCGRNVPVLFENGGENRETGRWEYAGYTPNYVRIRVAVPKDNTSLQNKIREVEITGLTPGADTLTGKLVSAC